MKKVTSPRGRSREASSHFGSSRKVKETLKTGLNALVWKEEDLFVTQCLEVDVASQGATKKNALTNLEEALELYFEDERLPALPESEYQMAELCKVFVNNFAYA